MMYLRDLGFNEKIIEMLEFNIPEIVIEQLQENKETVITNINYLKELGITNYINAFSNFYNMFLIDTTTFYEIFSKYDNEDLIAKLEKNIDIMEYL